ncbi:PREDICTED: mediator of RNA polymerase II transcription subunit 15-like isoform X2 [Papilio polytes]|uniref:mediator of RNA polymerase II transcription subunit 15-like isoform X2 n=1 Tax=Papilio polytes TaxID=76194 RepID=UPI000676AD39|nr:PREDICTED: mediator of RNA polymerase II transcription subunit 15-like isoform X2 [Papilio polytes]
MTTMIGRLVIATFCLQTFYYGLLDAAKQHVQLSDSYLPVAMQVIAHLTDQMAFEVKEEATTTKPTKPTTKPTTPKPLDVTTPFHRPGYYAPSAPPKPSERIKAQKQQQYKFQSPPQNQQQNNIPAPNQQFNSPPPNQQYNAPQQNQQQYNIPPQNQQQYNIPPQNQQQYNIPPQNQQEYNIPPQSQQEYNIPTQGQQQYNVPTENQQYNIPTQNQQQYNNQPETQQQYVSSTQNQQQPFTTQYQQQYNIPTQSQQQYEISQQYNTQTQNQQYDFPPQIQQQYNAPFQNQPFNVTQNQQTNFYSQQYNPLIQNQQYPQQNQQYGVMTFDFPQYNPIQPQNVRSEEPLLSAHHEEVKPLLEPTPDASHLLPPHFESDFDKISSRSKGFDLDEISEDNLQYLSKNVREMIRMAYDPNDDRLVDVWEGLRANPAEPGPKGKLSSSNLRLLLLYDLLSREAKRQRLSDYSGFSPDVMKTLVESSSGGAREQLRMALSKMVDRHDCEHEYANNRAKEMVAELAKDESKLSSEIRYLQPLVYKY